MSEHAIVQRWRHPALLIFVLGGFLGAFVNIGTTLLLADGFLVNQFFAFFVGTFLNQGFHFVYYNVVYVNKEVQLRTSFSIHLFLSFWVSVGSCGFLCGRTFHFTPVFYSA